MKKFSSVLIILTLVIVTGLIVQVLFKKVTPKEKNKVEVTVDEKMNTSLYIQLPSPSLKGEISLEEALSMRRSIRSYAQEPLTVIELSQLLWSAQGITNESGFRTAPSAGATFPLELYVVVNNVENLKTGLYHYLPLKHELEVIRLEDLKSRLTDACLGQAMITEAGAVFVFGAVFERTAKRYGDRAERYVYNEVGHAAQNLHLQAATLGLGTVVIGAFVDSAVDSILCLDNDVKSIYLMPVGKVQSVK